MLFTYDFSRLYWSYAVGHAMHIINYLPSHTLSGKLLYKVLYNEPPTYLNLKVCGSLCYASTLGNNRSKLDPRARKCVFLGYKNVIKGYILFYITNWEIFFNRNVVFYEYIFSYRDNEESSSYNLLKNRLHSTKF